MDLHRMRLAASLVCISSRKIERQTLPREDGVSGDMPKIAVILRVVIPIAILGIAALLLFTIQGRWTHWVGTSREQRTDDAYVRADMTPLSTRVSGTVRAVDVNDYQAVQLGQLLVQLDDADYRAALEGARAALAGVQAQLTSNQVEKQIQAAKIESAESELTQGAAAVSAAAAGIAAVQPEVYQTELERKRQEALLASHAATRQQEEEAVSNAGRFAGMLANSKAGLAQAQAALANSRAQLEAAKQGRAALDAKDGLYEADIEAKKAAIVVAEINLGYTRITAPTAGWVGERHVLPGQLVTPGVEIIDLVQGEDWVEANYKETQLTNIRVGDVADVAIDTFPGIVLHGSVAEISPASGSQFALLPPDNATGNFTKVVQRVPVKIVLDKDQPLEHRLRPGFSAAVTVHASGNTWGDNRAMEGSHP